MASVADDRGPISAINVTPFVDVVLVLLVILMVTSTSLVKASFGVDLPPTVTRFTVPSGVTNLAKEFKFEIIARASNGNNTAVESCYRVN